MKKMKKLIAVLLSVLIVLGVSPLAFAKEVNAEQNCPYIYIHGIMSKEPIYANPDDPNTETVWPPQTDKIKNMLLKCVPALGVYALTKDGKMISKVLTDGLNELLKGAALDENGEASNGSGVKKEYPAANTLSKNSRLTFNFDWRLDPIQIAAELNDYINYVCKYSSCDKVTLMGYSYGATICATYSKIYGNEKIQGMLMNASAFYGASFAGELMTGNLKVSAQSVKEYLRAFYDETEYNEILSAFTVALEKAGILENAEVFLNQLLADSYEELFGEAVMPLFTQWPMIWSMTPDEKLDEAMEYVFDGPLSKKDKDFSGLKEKIENYNTAIRNNREDILKEIESNCRFGVFSRYGYSAPPVSDAWTSLSDCVVDVKYSSFGATTAHYGEKLSESYLANADAKFISPDKTVDASTCLFPEKTWFVKNFNHMHSAVPPELGNLILYSDEEVTVDAFENYPQFLISENGEFNAQEKDDTKNFFEKIVELFKQMFKLLKNMFEKIF